MKTWASSSLSTASTTDVELLLHSQDEKHTRLLGLALARALGPDDVVSLSGDLGAGKTVLVKGVAEGLDVVEPVTSPTFNILLVHPGRLTLYHFDLYRLEREGQLEDVDFYEVLESGGASFVEWGDRFPGALPGRTLHASLAIAGDTERTLEISASGPRATRLAEDWLEAVRTVAER